MEKAGKVVVIGCGRAGSSIAYTLVCRQLCKELILCDINHEKALGEAYDIADASSFLDYHISVRRRELEDCQDAAVAIIAAGAATKPGESEEENVRRTIQICRGITDGLTENGFKGIILLLCNKVDTVLMDIYRRGGLPRQHVMGVGNALSNHRLYMLLAELLDVDERDIDDLYILGNYGTPSATFSVTSIYGKPLQALLLENGFTEGTDSLLARCVERGGEIGRMKTPTYYGVAAAAADITEAILFDKDEILSLSVLLEDDYGETDVFASVPTIIGRKGAKMVVEIPLSEKEEHRFRQSVEQIRKDDEKFLG